MLPLTLMLSPILAFSTFVAPAGHKHAVRATQALCTADATAQEQQHIAPTAAMASPPAATSSSTAAMSSPITATPAPTPAAPTPTAASVTTDEFMKILHDSERRRVASAVLPALENIDLQRENARLQQALEESQSLLEMRSAAATELESLRVENDRLATALRHSTSSFIGMGPGHHLALLAAHARAAAQAALRDLRFLWIWIRHELADMRVHASLVALIWQVRLAKMVKKNLMARFKPAAVPKAQSDPFAPAQ